jgi:hypothetical protein
LAVGDLNRAIWAAAGTVNERPKLLVGPIACVYARCRIREMGEGFLDQRDLKIMATTVVSCRR